MKCPLHCIHVNVSYCYRYRTCMFRGLSLCLLGTLICQSVGHYRHLKHAKSVTSLKLVTNTQLQ